MPNDHPAKEYIQVNGNGNHPTWVLIWSILHGNMQQFIRERINFNAVSRIYSNGFPKLDGDIARYVPMDTFPTENTAIPKGYNGFLLALDEFNSASLSVQAASYKIILDKMVGQYKLHPKTAIICAGNLGTNGAIVNRLSTAMQSRLIHLELSTDIELWTEWASKNNLDHRVVSYVHSRPENLHKFDPKHNDKTFACPRTWEFVARIIAQTNNTPLTEFTPLLAGTIGEGVAREFIAYSETINKLPSLDDLKRNPEGARLDEEPSMLYAVSHMIAAHTTINNLDTLMKYINRMPVEFQTITLQNILRRDDSLINEECVQDWIAVKGMELF